MAVIPALMTKTITFKRLDNKHVQGYEVYGLFKDDSLTSGVREVLLDSFDNPSEPNVQRSTIELLYNDNYTWQLPSDLYTDRDHKFRIYIDGSVLSTMYFQYNKYNRLLTINRNLKPLDLNNKIELEYYRDLITRTYPLEENCQIKIKPIFRETYSYGNHNVII